MRPAKRTREAVLEAGTAASLALALLALGVLALGPVLGGIRRMSRHRKPPPEPGTIPPTRHQQVGVGSPR